MDDFPILFEDGFDTSFVTPDWLVSNFTLFMLALFGIYSAFLVYHTLRYGRGVVMLSTTLVVYFAVSLVLITTMIEAALSLT